MAEIGQVPGGGLPWGGIYKAQTPFTDQVTANLIAQQADRRKYEQQTMLQTDEMMNKELANVRSIDMPDVTNAYGQWKNIGMQMLRPGIQTNPTAYNQLQIQKNQALGKVMGLINRSAQYNALGKQIGTSLQTKMDTYNEDAPKMLSVYYNTPMDKLTQADYNGKKIDLTDLGQYKYKGIDLSKLHAGAIGKMVTHYDDGTTDASGVQTTQHGYQYGNTPLEYRNAYVPGLSGKQANLTARSNWALHSDNQQDLDTLDAAYQNSPNWQKMGIAPQQLPPYNPNDPVGNEATYQAKQYLVGMNPAEVKAATTTNQAAKMNLQAGLKLHGQEIMAALNEKNKEKFALVQHNYKRLTAAEQGEALQDTYDTIVGQAKQALPHYYADPANKTVVKLHPIELSAKMKEVLSPKDDKGHPIYPDYVGITEDGQQVYPMYTNGEKIEGKTNVDAKLSQPITSAEFKALLGKTLYGVKEAVKESQTAPSNASGASGIKWQ